MAILLYGSTERGQGERPDGAQAQRRRGRQGCRGAVQRTLGRAKGRVYPTCGGCEGGLQEGIHGVVGDVEPGRDQAGKRVPGGTTESGQEQKGKLEGSQRAQETVVGVFLVLEGHPE